MRSQNAVFVATGRATGTRSHLLAILFAIWSVLSWSRDQITKLARILAISYEFILCVETCVIVKLGTVASVVFVYGFEQHITSCHVAPYGFYEDFFLLELDSPIYTPAVFYASIKLLCNSNWTRTSAFWMQVNNNTPIDFLKLPFMTR